MMVAGGGGGARWVKWVMRIKKDTYFDEPWVLYGNYESLNCTPETIIILCFT